MADVTVWKLLTDSDSIKAGERIKVELAYDAVFGLAPNKADLQVALSSTASFFEFENVDNLNFDGKGATVIVKVKPNVQVANVGQLKMVVNNLMHNYSDSLIFGLLDIRVLNVSGDTGKTEETTTTKAFKLAGWVVAAVIIVAVVVGLHQVEEII